MRLVSIEELLNECGSNRKLVISSEYKNRNSCYHIPCYDGDGTELENFKLIEKRNTNVWCPQTENQTWIMMQESDSNGVITITGNSGALVKCRKKGAKNWGESKK